ncbi:ferredoxin reductase family protein [Roseobacter sp. YSTF-M11]|uniref:Ferredoxin reductase family protein n=1 Tax=Roseobacter insulae TaxID=2859783 RepID=A0A9X1K3P5_9RHOB|nr:ferredoxin reductase family protein [Roseobacter insulae]MBW4709768.1 ferredoxin reductase family protein [Roseobacter insulae]
MNPFGLFLIAATALFPAYQLFALPDIADKVALFSQYLGLAALILMAWGQILATRLRGIETVFGGLDRVYVLHKWAGIVAMAAVLMHDTIDAEMRGLGRETALNELAETLGEVSLYGLLVLVVISVATFIPYHLWKWTHKAMGALFVAATFHFFFIMKPFAMTDPAGIYTGFFCLAGIAAYLWTMVPERLRPSHAYRIAMPEQTGGALALTMTPEGAGLRRPLPGQFGILSFSGAGTGEPHPFTFSGIAPDGTLRVTIKALGDFTTSLRGSLEVGQALHIQGPFGRFRLSGKGREVWIAGGIGITPFLAWAEALGDNAGTVDLFYCVSSRNAAPHLAEITELAKAKQNLRLHVIASAQGARLTAEGVADVVGGDLSKARVSFCGPLALRAALQTGLRRYGVTPRRFHYEEFEFRTGVGLKQLAQWIVNRTWRETQPSKSYQG